jgi:phospholipid/cholesterol/gamma-HCH transport system ATP-binding protein
MIELEDVTLAYGDLVVLDGVSLRIASNQITSILGPSGSGKSTIIKLILGLIKPSSGRVLVEGVDISRMKEKHLFPIRQKMGMVFQGNALFDSLTVTENLSFFLLENLKLPKAEATLRIKAQVEFAGLQGFENHFPDTLSGGMKKRLAIGRALIFGPEMVLLDEPTVGLDPISTKKVLDVIQRLKHDKGLGAVLVTHLINDVFGIADRVIILFDGKIIFNDVPDAMHGFRHPFVESFLSNSVEIA